MNESSRMWMLDQARIDPPEPCDYCLGECHCDPVEDWEEARLAHWEADRHE